MSQNWFKQIFFTIAEHGGIRVLDALTTLLFIRVMSSNDFGLFSLYQSWISMLLLFFPAIELVLFREYSKLKSNGSLVHEMGVYRSFNIFKLVVGLALMGALSFVDKDADQITRYSLLVMAFLLPFSQSFFSFLREPLRFELKQHLVAILGMLQRMILIVFLVFAAFIWPNKSALLCMCGFMAYAVSGLMWSYSLKQTLPELTQNQFIVWDKKSWNRISEIFFSTVIWIHLSGVMTATIQTFDVFALGHFQVSLSEIGAYSVALKAANFFQILPVALANSFGVYLAHNGGGAKKVFSEERKRVSHYTLGFIALCGGLYAIAYFTSHDLLGILARGRLSSELLNRASEYFRWQVAGTLLLCATYPVSTYLSARASLVRVSLFVNIPWLLLSIPVYFLGAEYGPLMAAKMNVVVAAMAAMLLTCFYLLRR